MPDAANRSATHAGLDVKRRGFLQSLAALPLLDFLKPDEDAMDAKAAREALADPVRIPEACIWQLHHENVATTGTFIAIRELNWTVVPEQKRLDTV